MKRTTPLILIIVSLVCFAALPAIQAVSPPPDGGYPGGNTAEGQAALLSLTTGSFNTAVGFFSLRTDALGQFNTALGAGTLLANVGDPSSGQGVENTATGAGAMLNNTSGYRNTANGALALVANTTGGDNTAVGDSALIRNSGGGANAAIGFDALFGNTTGNDNVSIGAMSLGSNSTGNFNTAVGNLSLGSSSGNNNTAIGNSAGSNVTTVDNVICIGAGVGGANVSNTCFIGNVHGVTTQNNDAIPVLIDSTGQLGTASSSRRYKTDIKPIDEASESILALQPVSFRYKVHKDMKPQFGLIAEEVAEVNPDLVIYDRDHNPYTVRYDAVNAMLLNEFLKEHRTVQEQGATIARLQKQIDALTTGLQKVSVQLEASKPAPQVADSNY